MVINLTELSELDATLVAQRRSLLAQYLQEAMPTLDMKRGVIYSLMIGPAAMFSAQSEAFWTELAHSRSLSVIGENPAEADEATVDEILSNYLVERLAGSTSHGNVTIVLDELSSTTIAAFTQFQAQGLYFITQTAFAARETAGSVLAATDRLLIPLSDGTYAFTVELYASAIGEGSRLKKNAILTPVLPISHFVKAYAAEDFVGGYDAETIAASIARLLPGLTARSFSGRAHMAAALRGQAAFERVIADSIVGFGDGEMLRDRHTIFPGAMGGRVDWYIRTAALPQSLGLTKIATLMEKTEDGYGLWQFSLGRDEAPGFYDIPQVWPSDSGDHLGTYTITSETRSFDGTTLANDGFLPDFDISLEAAYSRFQTATVVFKDTNTPTSALTENVSTQEYAITVRVMPLIGEIQDYGSARKYRSVAADLVAKAPVPCFLTLSFTLQLLPGQASPDVTQIQNALAAYVNATGFIGRLPASKLTDIVQEFLVGDAYAEAVDMLGRIRRPDGSIKLLRSTETLIVPDEPSRMVTARTVTFFLDPNDIAVTVQTAEIPEV